MEPKEEAEDKNEWITVHGEFTEEEDDLDIGLYMEATFQGIDDWLVDICKNDTPQKEIGKFVFGVYEYLDGYTLCLTGINSYEEGTHTKTKIEYLPTHYLFRIPAAYHEHLEREETFKKIKADLDNFARSETFKASFFRSSKLILFDTTMEIIWSK